MAEESDLNALMALYGNATILANDLDSLGGTYSFSEDDEFRHQLQQLALNDDDDNIDERLVGLSTASEETIMRALSLSGNNKTFQSRFNAVSIIAQNARKTLFDKQVRS